MVTTHVLYLHKQGRSQDIIYWGASSGSFIWGGTWLSKKYILKPTHRSTQSTQRLKIKIIKTIYIFFSQTWEGAAGWPSSDLWGPGPPLAPTWLCPCSQATPVCHFLADDPMSSAGEPCTLAHSLTFIMRCLLQALTLLTWPLRLQVIILPII
jgi:hypothetical protein